jgi:hypothetical protein
MAEHLVRARRVLEPQHPVAAFQGVHQVPIREEVIGSGPAPCGLQAQAELWLTGRDPLLRRGLQRLQLRLIVCRPEMLNCSYTNSWDATS